MLADYNAKMAQGIDPADLSKERPSYCGPPKFVGFNGGLQDYVEFLFTPGRVTITNELGLIRRVTLGEKPPTMTQPTNSGISVGHWEGETLVIESTGFDPDLGMGEPTSKVPIKVGRNLHLIERFTLVGPDRMEVTQRMSAPEIFTAPAENKTFYKRNRDHVMREMSNCVNNRAFDNATGRERFDLTPPPDLPPPPSG